MVDIVGGRARISIEGLREVWRYREVLWAFVLRSVKARYRQAVFGIGWAVIQPVLGAVLFAIFLGRYSKVSSDGAPYLLFALAGMSAWTFFSTAASTSSDSIVANQSLLKKVYFPREILPLSAVSASLLDLAISLVVVAVAAAAYGDYPTVAWLALPLPVFVLIVAAAFVGIGLSAINVYYRDVRYALPFLLQVGIFATPVVYALEAIPAAWRQEYAVLNPLAAAIDAVRRIIIHGQWPHFGTTCLALLWSVLLLLASYAGFKRLERGLSDRV